ncbi:KTSC domain-containing protein [Marilutibacter spongiae]|uniref:KTSC domain-containing protein n=1 Tax=Marilutibacter spongiae TaxID=2025720 RepID=A0A7W3TLQ1_9GAMM|nr:KTSC domain-containing protein [Lysobacter spongiae]MBB1060384.1 KTSC domain-containing protein [Lysobacter spongiae]
MNRIALNDVDSSQIAAIGHDPETNTLAIRFKTWKGEPSSLYHYANFTADDFAAFQEAESKGRHFGAHIKPFPEKYPYTRVEAKPSAPIADAA